MKTILHAPRMKRTLMHVLAAIAVFTLAYLPANAKNTSEKIAYKDSIVVNKLLTSKKYKIKIYPSATNEVLFFNAVGDEGKVYQFYIFDIDGNMVKQTQIRNKQTTIITNLSKGSYTFEVFSDDEHIENGTLTIK
ncbi:MAG: T9SS type A sorting domain-containing protein [Chitinophagaceae bacterium]